MAGEKEKSQTASFRKVCLTCGREFSDDLILCPDDDELLTPIRTDSLIGTVLAGKYEIMEKLGAGGMGLVYKARHTLMKRLVAIKIMLPQLISSVSALKRFKQEAQAASSLNHPNILAVFDFGVTPDGMPYLVMDFLEGSNLGKELEHTHFDVPAALEIFVQSCVALSHAHKNGIVHRDLKPANIMLVEYEGRANFVKIVDFGMAKILGTVDGEMEDLTKSGEIFGSPLYMSPEQCMGKELDARSDIYSLGCVMYRTLTGCPAIQGSSAIECFSNHVNLLPPCFADACPGVEFPQGLEAIVFKAIAKDPEQRFQTMDELKDALLACAGLPISSSFGNITATSSLRATEQKTAQANVDAAARSAADNAAINTASGTSASALGATRVSPSQSAGAGSPPSSKPAPQSSPIHQASQAPTPPAAAPEQRTSPSGSTDMAKGLSPKLIGIAAAALVLVGGGIFAILPKDKSGSSSSTSSSTPSLFGAPESASGDLMKEGRSAYDHGDYAEAVKKFQAAIDKAKSKGDYDHGVPEAQLWLGKSYFENDDLDNAIAAYQSLLKYRESGKQLSAGDATEALNDLGNCYLGKRNFKQAQTYYQKALSIRQGYTGPEHVKVAETLAGLGNLALAQGQNKQALASLTKAQQIVDSSPAADDGDKANIYSALGQAYQFTGKLTQARTYYQKALDLREKTLSPDSPAIADTLLYLGTLEFRNKNLARSEELLNRALEIAKRAPGSSKTSMAEIQFCLGVLYDKKKDKAKAIEMVSSALKIREAQLGPNNQDTVDTRNYLTQLQAGK